jgi:hypothetical protein
MKRIWVATFVALISLMVMAGMSHAALLTLESTHNITATLKKADVEITPSSYYLYAGVTGTAYYPFEGWVFDTKNTTSDPSVTATLPVGTWLKQTDATTGRSTATTLTFAQKFVASAPSPGLPIDPYGGASAQSGSVSIANNSVSNIFTLYYAGLTAGTYTVNLTDIYTYAYSLVQGAGSSNQYISASGSLVLGLRAASGSDPSKVRPVYSSPNPLVSYAKEDPEGLPLLDFGSSGGGTAPLGKTIYINSTQDMYIQGFLGSFQSGSTVVPLPGALVLLGAGLVRLVIYRRRKTAAKS